MGEVEEVKVVGEDDEVLESEGLPKDFLRLSQTSFETVFEFKVEVEEWKNRGRVRAREDWRVGWDRRRGWSWSCLFKELLLIFLTVEIVGEVKVEPVLESILTGYEDVIVWDGSSSHLFLRTSSFSLYPSLSSPRRSTPHHLPSCADFWFSPEISLYS